MKILLADDCATTRGILRKNLTEWGYEPVLAEDGEAALRALRDAGGPRLAILDWSMPKLEGPSVCRQLRESPTDRYTYLIMLTARDGEDFLVEALEAGADDFLSKPVSTKELQQRVRAGKRVVELQDRLLSTHRKLAQLATRDQLTGVLNRVAIMDQLGEELERARNNTRQLGLLMLDIDAFNFINEEFGYPAGDEVLREMAGRLKRTIQSYDRVGRVSGGAFSVVVPETDLPHAVVVAERLRNEVRHQPFVIDGREITVSVSVGAASTSIEGFERKKLMVGAEKALARAKRDGRDCTRMSVGNGVIEDPLVSDLEVFA